MIPFTGTPQSWNEIIATIPHANCLQKTHYTQTWQWSQAKARSGWQPLPFIWQDENGNPIAAAMVLKRGIPVPGLGKRVCVLFVPKGPILNWDDEPLRLRVLKDLRVLAKQKGGIYIKIDPDVTFGTGIPGTDCSSENENGHIVCSDLLKQKWQYSKEQVQFNNTILIDLTADEEEIFSRMKRQTRQHVRQAQRFGVTVRTGTVVDYPLLIQMFKETAQRDGFTLQEEGFYQFLWRSFQKESTVEPSAQPFIENMIAEVDGEPASALTIFYFAGHATALYGMRFNVHNDKMPNYLLHWEVMRKAKAYGCRVYDLYGVPDVFEECSRLWTVYRFKAGLGGEVYRGVGAWDNTPRPILYKLYMDVLPFIKRTFRIPGPPYTKSRQKWEKISTRNLVGEQ